MITILWTLLLVFMSVMTFTIIFKTIKNERNRKNYKPGMKSGDNVSVSIISNSIDGEIIEVSEQTVIIKTLVPKDRVYPKK